MQFLAQRELITLLNVPFVEGQAHLSPYETRQGGAYCEPVPGVRVYGLRYQGSATAAAIKAVGEALAQQPRQGIDYTIFVAHAGMENVLPGHTAGLSHAQVAPLRPYVDYLALGHVHKPYAFDNWIYNPGSPESCSMEEVAWSERGYYLVDVDTARRSGETPPETPAHLPVLQANRRRPFHRLFFKVDLCESPEMLLAQCEDYIRQKARDLNARPDLPREEQPVVELRLSGVLPFDRASLVTAPLEALIHERFGPLLCQIKNQTTPAAFSVAVDANLNRRELEAQIIGDLLSRDARFRENQAEWTNLLLEIKRLALTNASPESIVDTLSSMTR
jgi:DNA repair exonuclease SbcCD nuclease subunit